MLTSQLPFLSSEIKRKFEAYFEFLAVLLSLSRCFETLHNFAISDGIKTFMVIYISNLGKKVTADSLELLFATHGIVSSTRLLTSNLSGRPNGEALVEMAHGHEAQHAIFKLNGSIIDGHVLAVTTMNPATWVDRIKNKLGNYEY